MKHNHLDDNFRGALKQTGRESPYSTRSAEDLVDSRPEAETFQPIGNGGESERLNDQQRLELSRASARNRHLLNPIQSVWPTPSA